MRHPRVATGDFTRLPGVPATLLLVGLVVFGPCPPTAVAQLGGQAIPTMAYRAAFYDFNEGEYRDALKEFLAEGRSAIKTPQSRWIDSICYHTMCGECYYHMGELSRALEHYTSAVKFYVAFSDWMIRVKFPPQIRPAGAARQRHVPWGQRSRTARLGHYPKSTLVSQGQIDINRQIREGGVVRPPIFIGIEVQEIVRATTLAIRRRTELLGPVSGHDRLTMDLLAALQRRPGPPNHWSEAWIDLQLGLALIAAGKEGQALPRLQRAVVAAGQFDHPMTSIALLELGRLAMKRGDWAAATTFLEEATYAAVNYPDAGVLEEALSYAALVHLMANRKGVCPLLLPAARWARQKKQNQLEASLLLLAAENYAVLGDTQKAAGLLEEAQGAIGKRDMGSGWIGARLVFLRALVLFQQGKIAEGDAALATAMAYMRHGSHWLFHIRLADKLYVDGEIDERMAKERVAMELYSEVLRDPRPTDWSTSPMETLAVLSTPHPVPLEHWFEVAMKRKEREKALNIADRCRRHRYFSSLCYGGRLQSLRWILEGPTAAIDRESQLHRQDLLVRFPAYAKLAEQARHVRTELSAMPLVVDGPEAVVQQKKGLAELGRLSRLQEAMLREIAVRREPGNLVFPPLRTTAAIRKALPKGHAILVFFATRRHLYGFLMNSEKYSVWRVGSPAVLARQIMGMLRKMGHFEQNRELTVKELTNTGWMKPAQKVLDSILKGSRADFSTEFDELIIVPDGVLWYVPFEALQVRVKQESHALISRVRIRYAPTAGLTIPNGRRQKPTGNTAVVVGRLYPRDDPAVTQNAFDQLAHVVPGTVALPNPLPAPSSVYAALFDRLIVFDDLFPPKNGPYSWAPVQIEWNKPGNSLNDWLSLPWGGPQTVILPGYHTAAENALKRVDATAAGTEMFLSLCGLMSSGARTVLLGRWRTGGQTSFDLAREFAQELPFTAPADAWQRAVLLTMDCALDLPAEPRIKQTAADKPLKADHPFFWAGYMLIDSGTIPKQPADPPAAKDQ